MSHPTKIATCSYCSTRTAFVLAEQAQHKLTCSACGAPLLDVELVKAVGAGKPSEAVVATVAKPVERADSTPSSTSSAASSQTRSHPFGVPPVGMDPRTGKKSRKRDDDDDDEDDDDDDDDDDRTRQKARKSKHLSSGKKNRKQSKKKRRKTLTQRLIDKASDAIEDLFD